MSDQTSTVNQICTGKITECALNTVYYCSSYELVKDEENMGFDLTSIEDRFIECGTRVLVKTDLVTAFHKSLGAFIKSRSGFAFKGVDACGGVIDAGYRETWGIILDNARCVKDSLEVEIDGKKEIKRGIWVRKGDRIAQAIFLPTINVETVRVASEDQLPSSKRGKNGFGSSGVQNRPKPLTSS
jgi:deoxyuridine 5'-triphosphate nucleotidohydrolase